jgi:5-methylcytosine-specific restriction protein A
MPWRPATHQSHGRTLRDQRYDAEHQDTTAKQVRNSARWQKLRAVVLNTTPLCADPFLVHRGSPVPATQVDHIIPLDQRPDLAYNLDNLQGLCTFCHSRKTTMERRRKRMMFQGEG